MGGETVLTNNDQHVKLESNDAYIWIETPEPFDFMVNLDYLQRNPKECMYDITDGIITRVIDIAGERVLVRIDSPDNRKLRVQFLSDASLSTRKMVVAYIWEWFDLSMDLSGFYEWAQYDPLLNEPVERFYGLRIMGIPDLFETLCWGILGQQINLGFAYTLKRQFVEKYGDAITFEGMKYWSFPSYESIAKLSPTDLSDIKMTIRKSEYIIGIAQLMATGQLAKKQLLSLGDFKQIENALVAIRGIGPWTANYVMMRCLRFPNAFPIDDVGLHLALKQQMGLGRKPTKDEIRKVSVNWKGWEAYATFYLWRSKY